MPTDSRSKKKVLLVDDSPTTLMFEEIIVSKLRYEIITAKDGFEAIEVAAKEKPDVILMDVMMPRMNGIEACRAIRRSTITGHIPIIMVTTMADEESIEAGRRAGCTDYVSKPINANELLAKMRACLGESR